MPYTWGSVIREMAAGGKLVGQTMVEDGHPESGTEVLEVVIDNEGTSAERVRFVGKDWEAGCRTKLVGYTGSYGHPVSPPRAGVPLRGLRIHAMGLDMSWTFTPAGTT